MFLKKFLLFGLIAAVLPAFAEEGADRKTATSLKYVEHELDTRQNKFTAESNKAMEYTDSAGTVEKRAVKSNLGNDTSDTSLPMVGGVNTKLATKQDDIAPINDHTAVTYTGTSGKIGAKGIYQATESYVEQSDNLIDAKTFNAALKRGLDSEFLCSEYKPGTDLCWVWSIHNNGDDALPNDYTPLEYIISDGHQYINTEISPTADTFYKLEVMFADRGNGYRFFGSGENGAVAGFGATSMSFYINNTVTPVITDISNTFNQKMIVDYKGTNVNINGTDYTCDRAGATSDKMYINARADSLNSRVGAGKWYRVTIGSGTTVLADFVPARNASGVAGMYDLVRRRFFPSTSGTNFTAGPEKDAPYTTLVPAGYTPVEYIISNGTQYFDSGRKATDKSEVSVTVMATIEDAARSRLIGNFADFSKAFTINMSTREGVSRFGNQSAINTPMPINSNHVYSNGAGGLRMDGNVLHAWSTQPAFETLGNVALLASTNTTTTVPSNLTNGLAGNTYNITWHEDGVLVMNLIPARRNQDSVVGMYDTVSGTFFENAGTGVFQAGPDINNIIYVPQNQ